ncbi:ATP-binding protein, partial [Arthrospira platensis SPKY1]|nr:ATP-binding protein [Arthrospira platensis SPKY1]
MKAIDLTVQDDAYRSNIFADRYMTETILRNLVGNALKFTMPGGEVRIQVERRHQAIAIEVQDNGIGLSSAQMNELFKMDGKIQRLGTAKEKGTGLGLIIVKDFL